MLFTSKTLELLSAAQYYHPSRGWGLTHFEILIWYGVIKIITDYEPHCMSNWIQGYFLLPPFVVPLKPQSPLLKISPIPFLQASFKDDVSGCNLS